MRFGIYMSKTNGELFEIVGEISDCYIIRYGQFDITAVGKKEVKKVKTFYIGEL